MKDINKDTVSEKVSSILVLPEISETFKDSNNTMTNLFTILSLSLGTKRKIDSIIDMSYMFSGCISLKSLPDISKWNTKNVTNISYMFYGCQSLKSLPDISKWNTSNILKMSYFF